MNYIGSSLITKFQRHRVSLSYQINIWGADLADVQLISKYNKGSDSWCVVFIFTSNMHSLFHWRIKKGITINEVFQKILIKCSRKPSKISVDQCSKFFNRSMKSRLNDNEIETYSTYTGKENLLLLRDLSELAISI